MEMYKVGEVSSLLPQAHKIDKEIPEGNNQLTSLFERRPKSRSSREVLSRKVTRNQEVFSNGISAKLVTSYNGKHKATQSDKSLRPLKRFRSSNGQGEELVDHSRKIGHVTKPSSVQQKFQDEIEPRTTEKKRKSKAQLIEDRIQNRRTVFVGNLPKHTTKKDVKNVFKEYGKVETIRFRSMAPVDLRMQKKVVAIKKALHESRNSFNAYVVFSDEVEARHALAANGINFEGNHIRCDLAGKSKQHNNKCSIFVGNLAFDIEEETVHNHFSECGTVKNVRIIRDRKSGIGRGFGYVLFASEDCVTLALKLNNSVLHGREIRVSRAVKKKKSTDVAAKNNGQTKKSKKVVNSKTNKPSRTKKMPQTNFPKNSKPKSDKKSKGFHEVKKSVRHKRPASTILLRKGREQAKLPIGHKKSLGKGVHVRGKRASKSGSEKRVNSEHRKRKHTHFN